MYSSQIAFSVLSAPYILMHCSPSSPSTISPSILDPSVDFTREFGTILRQATTRALSTIASLAHTSTTLVALSQPKPPGTGTNVRGSARMNMAGLSDVSWARPPESQGHPHVPTDPCHTRNSH